MRLGAIQSNYIPWRGYFDFIASCDVFVFHDCVQYTDQDWRNRNKIKTSQGTKWITVPVKKHSVHTPINEIEIAGDDWIYAHRNALFDSLRLSQHCGEALGVWSACESNYKTLHRLNQMLTRRICDYLGIRTKLVNSKSLELEGSKTARLIDMCRKLGADVYLSGPGAKSYLDVGAMNKSGIAVEWKTYNYQPYPQRHGAFENVTVLDLIANVGRKASDHVREVE